MSEGKEGSSPEVLAEQELKQLETERDELLEKHSSWLGADTVKALKFAPSQEVVATMQKFMQEKGWETQVAKFISEIAGLDVPANQSG
ncbi:MAG: hypothetical protein V1695_00505, partial [Candidatus Uhrbacteria bacterium]